MYKYLLVFLILFFIGCSDKMLMKWDGQQATKYQIFYWEGVDTTLCPIKDDVESEELSLYFLTDVYETQHLYETKLDTLGYVRIGVSAEGTTVGVSRFYKKTELK